MNIVTPEKHSGKHAILSSRNIFSSFNLFIPTLLIKVQSIVNVILVLGRLNASSMMVRFVLTHILLITTVAKYAESTDSGKRQI